MSAVSDGTFQVEFNLNGLWHIFIFFLLSVRGTCNWRNLSVFTSLFVRMIT